MTNAKNYFQLTVRVGTTGSPQFLGGKTADSLISTSHKSTSTVLHWNFHFRAALILTLAHIIWYIVAHYHATFLAMRCTETANSIVRTVRTVRIVWTKVTQILVWRLLGSSKPVKTWWSTGPNNECSSLPGTITPLNLWLKSRPRPRANVWRPDETVNVTTKSHRLKTDWVARSFAPNSGQGMC